MARQPDEVTQLHEEAGAKLGEYLDTSPLNQGHIASATHYHRTSISHIIAGRQFPDRPFWETVDTLLKAGGNLVAKYDEVCSKEARIQQAELERAQNDRQAKLIQLNIGTEVNRQETVLHTPPSDQFYVDSAPIDIGYIEHIHDEIKELE